jgi:hypothetical protein
MLPVADFVMQSICEAQSNVLHLNLKKKILTTLIFKVLLITEVAPFKTYSST